MHPYNQQPDLHAYMKKHDIIGQSYAPLAPIVHKPDEPLAGPLKDLAKKYYKTEGQVLLRWNLQKGCVVITTSGKKDRMSEQLDIMNFELDQSDMDLIDSVGSKLQYRKYFDKELSA